MRVCLLFVLGFFFGNDGQCMQIPEPGEMTMDEVGPNPMFPLQLPPN